MDEWFGEPLHGRFLAAILNTVPTECSYCYIPTLASFSFAAAPGAFWLWEAGLLPASMCGQGGEYLFIYHLLASQ